MTEVNYYEVPSPEWADLSMAVEADGVDIFILHFKAVNFSTRRFYLGLDFYGPASCAALREFHRLFAEATKGLELEAQVAKADQRAQRFCTFFGFSRIPNYEVAQDFVYERLG